METRGELITAAAIEKKPVTGIREFLESLNKKETVQQKSPTEKGPHDSPAPFYDELHFANYE